MTANRKAEDQVTAALAAAKTIPDSDVCFREGPTTSTWEARVASQTTLGDWYTVHQDHTPGRDGELVCSCDAALQGDKCKHLLKVLLMRHPHLGDMQIIIALGTRKGTKQSGIRQLLGDGPVKEAPTASVFVPRSEQEVEPEATESTHPLTGSAAHNRQPLTRAEEAHSCLQGRLAEVAALVDLASCQDKRFCDRMEPLTQQLLVSVKAGRVRIGGVDGAEVQPHLVKVKSAYGAKNSLKRGMSFLEKGGKRTSKKARGENVPVSGPPLKGANAKGPARPTLLQQLVKRAGKGGSKT